jgi:hypothetical protein
MTGPGPARGARVLTAGIETWIHKRPGSGPDLDRIRTGSSPDPHRSARTHARMHARKHGGPRTSMILSSISLSCRAFSAPCGPGGWGRGGGRIQGLRCCVLVVDARPQRHPTPTPLHLTPAPPLGWLTLDSNQTHVRDEPPAPARWGPVAPGQAASLYSSPRASPIKLYYIQGPSTTQQPTRSFYSTPAPAARGASSPPPGRASPAAPRCPAAGPPAPRA